MTDYHKLFSRQLKKSKDKDGQIDQDNLYDLVSQAYFESDKRYSLLNKSMELMSDEMSDLNRSLRKEAERTDAILESVSDGIFSIDEKGIIHSSNKGAQTIFGYEESELNNMPLQRLLPKYDFSEAKHKVDFAKNRNGENPSCLTETAGNTKEKKLFDAEVYIAPLSMNEENFYVCNVRDVTIQKQSERSLYDAAFYDKLTGLPNRALFLEKVQEIVERNRRNEAIKASLLFIDLDRFKFINDSLGHQAGDNLLCQVATRLRSVARKYDVVSRLGGDEFTVLVNGTSDEKGLRDVAERFIKAFEKPFKITGREFNISSSIGAFVITNEQKSAEEILRNSDLAMYKAKKSGRGCFAMFHEDQLAEISDLLNIENDLRRAISNNELMLYFQPITDLKTENISGFESLVRWEHPEKGMILPDTFISIAEESSLINDLGLFVLRESCEKIKEFQKLTFPGETLSISVNVSPNQLKTPEDAQRIIEVIKEANLEPGVLKLECTESAFMKQDNNIKSFFNEVKKHGVGLSIDDFGTGYSALEYIHRFPFDILKIDRTFITSMTSNPKDLNLVTGIVSLSHNLGLKIVAEGVENIDELRLLEKMNVEYIQGYYYSRPLPYKAACDYVNENRISRISPAVTVITDDMLRMIRGA